MGPNDVSPHGAVGIPLVEQMVVSLVVQRSCKFVSYKQVSRELLSLQQVCYKLYISSYLDKGIKIGATLSNLQEVSGREKQYQSQEFRTHHSDLWTAPVSSIKVAETTKPTKKVSKASHRYTAQNQD
jgi:hypothetical protein